MYSYLRGAYKGRSPESDGAVLLEAGGVGYEVVVPPIVERELASSYQLDDPLLLYVSPLSSRDQPWPTLFGFLRPEERAFFELLRSVPRFGGRLAARAMAVPIERLAEAIQQGNKAYLDELPGVTLDGAEKMIASLRKKVAPFVRPAPSVQPRVTVTYGIREDVVNALVHMGARRLDAERGVDHLLATRDDLVTVQDLLTEYLRAYRSAGRAG
jgi:Holliday junction resolvasome RuvABC DNA-binding subunit